MVLAAGCARPASDVPPPPLAPKVDAAQLVRAADAAHRAGRDAEALRTYRRAIEAYPRSAPAHLRFLGLLLEQGRGSEARAFYASRTAGTVADRAMVARLRSDGSAAALRGVYESARKEEAGNAWWRMALGEIELVEVDRWTGESEAAQDAGDRDASEEAAREATHALRRARYQIGAAVQLEPTWGEVHLYRGLLAAVEADRAASKEERDAKFREAVDAYAMARRIDPGLAEAWEGEGDAWFELGEVTPGLKAMLAAAERRPQDAGLRLALGSRLHGMERYGEAVRQFQAASALDPRSPEPWRRRGDALVEAGRFEEALAAYAGALARDGGLVEIHFERAAVFERMGRHGEAIASYERYVAAEGERRGAAEQRIETLLRLGEEGGL